MKKLLQLLVVFGLTSTTSTVVVSCTQNKADVIADVKEISKPKQSISLSVKLLNELGEKELKLNSQSQESILDISKSYQDKENKKLYKFIVKHKNDILPFEDVIEKLEVKIDDKQILGSIEIIIKKHQKVDISDIEVTIKEGSHKEDGIKIIEKEMLKNQIGIKNTVDYEIDLKGAHNDEGYFEFGKKIYVNSKSESKLIFGKKEITIKEKETLKYDLSEIISGSGESNLGPSENNEELIKSRVIEQLEKIGEHVGFDLKGLKEDIDIVFDDYQPASEMAHGVIKCIAKENSTKVKGAADFE